LSASAINDEQLQSFLDDGVRAVLKKPISIDELTTVIEQIGH
jgi:CheY-like chemotaxis protein